MGMIENNICQAVEIIAEKVLNNAGYDKTIKALIVNCVNQESGKYKIKYQDSYSYAYSTSPEIHYKDKTYVYVQVPGGDMSQNKTILNAVENSQVGYGYVVNEEDTYDKIGANIISSSKYPFTLYSAKLGEIDLYRKDGSIENLLDVESEAFALDINNADSILCGATFRTAFDETPVQGNYGIGFELKFETDKDSPVFKTFILDINNMEGNPYLYSNSSRQYQIFNLDGAVFKEINRIYLFIEDFSTLQKNELELTNEDIDVYVSDLELQALKKMTEEEINGYALRVFATSGNTFYQGEESNSTRRFLAQLKYRGLIVNEREIKYYWFRENKRISSNSKSFNQYGGIGWECLNNKTSEEIPNWVAATASKEIEKNLVTAREIKFKCVAVHQNNPISKEFIINNIDNNIPILTLSIERDDGTKEKDRVSFENGIGIPTITCLVDEQEEKDYSYKWIEEDSYGVSQNIIKNEEENLQAFRDFKEIFITWENELKKIPEDKRSKKDKKLILQMDNYLLQFERCSLNTESMITTTSQSKVGELYNKVINLIKIFGDRTFVTYNEFLLNIYDETLETLKDEIVILKALPKYSKYSNQMGKENKNISLALILSLIENQYPYQNFNKDIYDKWIHSLIDIIESINKSEESVAEYIDILYNDYQQLLSINSQRILDYYGNKIYNYKVYEINNFSNIKCSVINSKEEYLGTANLTIINKRENRTGILNLLEGSQVFQYNEAGISPADASSATPQVIFPLSFSLYTASGESVPFSRIINNGFVEWKVPVENTLIQINLEDYPQEDIEIREERGITYNIYKNISSLPYTIKQKYSYSTYNQIELLISYNNTVYTAKTNFSFLKQGEIGSSGQSFVCRIVPNTNMSLPPQYPIFTKRKNEKIGNFNFINPKTDELWKIGMDTTDALGERTDFPFLVEIYENGNPVYKSNISGSSNNINYNIEWEFLSNNSSQNTSDFTIVKEENKPLYLVLTNGVLQEGNAENILKCKITRETDIKNIFYATMPIVTVNVNTSEEINIEIKDGTGFQFVEYSSGGTLPMYNDLIPFELNVNYLEDTNYKWEIMGDLFSIEDVLDEEEKVIKNQIKAIAPLIYNGLNVNSGISCILTNQERQNIANIYIPIHCYLNRYGFSQLNEWDGNSIKIDENGGFILAPQLAAGVKNQENAFTGLLMGEAHASNWSAPQNGLFGFYNGQRTLFLDAETGGAIFGTSAANISIGGASDSHSSTYDRLWLYSSNFWKTNAFNEKGFLENNVTYRYRYDENKNAFNWSGGKGAGDGLLIDFNKPAIIFGNGNFSVENGDLRARDAVLKGRLTLQNSQDVKIGEFSNSGIEFFYDNEEDGINVSMGGIFTETIKASYQGGSSALYRGMSFLLDNSSYSFLNRFIAFGTRENNKSNYALTWGRENTDTILKGFTFNDTAYFQKDIYIEKKASFSGDFIVNSNKKIFIQSTNSVDFKYTPMYGVYPKTVFSHRDAQTNISYYYETYSGEFTDINGKVFYVKNGLIVK